MLLFFYLYKYSTTKICILRIYMQYLHDEKVLTVKFKILEQ